MSFQAYLDNIETKPGKAPADFNLDQGHTMPIVTIPKGTKE